MSHSINFPIKLPDNNVLVSILFGETSEQKNECIIHVTCTQGTNHIQEPVRICTNISTGMRPFAT
jgi:uncharacterized protein VirK/YbjX